MPPIILGGALIVPAGLLAKLRGSPVPTMFARDTKRIEQLAMKAIMDAERRLGFIPTDVSDQKLGWDIESSIPNTGRLRFIEVKGRAAVGEIGLTRNEYQTAERLKAEFWLYAVFKCGGTPELCAVQDPARLHWDPIVTVEHYRATAQAVRRATETPKP